MQASDNRAEAIWRTMILVGPITAGVLPLLVLVLSGVFEKFQWINQRVTFFQSIGILGAMCFPCGAFLYARRKWNQARARLSRTWPTAAGHVRSSEVQRRITGMPMVLWKLGLSYRYEVEGRAYQGDAVQFGPRYVSSRELVEAQAAKYPSGATVTVRYDPDDPATSVLEASDEMALQNGWQIWIYAMAPPVISAIVAVKHALSS